jgi:hypothetical protein
MRDQNTTPRSDDIDLLKLLNDADAKADHAVPFEYLPLHPWRFGWLLHPGLDCGTCVVDSNAFDRLVAAACIRITDVDLSVPSCHAVLTEQGRRHLSSNDDEEDTLGDEPEDHVKTLHHDPAGIGWAQIQT